MIEEIAEQHPLAAQQFVEAAVESGRTSLERTCLVPHAAQQHLESWRHECAAVREQIVGDQSREVVVDLEFVSPRQALREDGCST